MSIWAPIIMQIHIKRTSQDNKKYGDMSFAIKALVPYPCKRVHIFVAHLVARTKRNL